MTKGDYFGIVSSGLCLGILYAAVWLRCWLLCHPPHPRHAAVQSWCCSCEAGRDEV